MDRIRAFPSRAEERAAPDIEERNRAPIGQGSGPVAGARPAETGDASRAGPAGINLPVAKAAAFTRSRP